MILGGPFTAVRGILLLVATIGTVLFGGVFVTAATNPLQVEKASREILRTEIEARTGVRIRELSDSALLQLAKARLRETEAAIEKARDAIRNDVPRRVADVVSNMLRVDCECRRKLAKRAERMQAERLGSLTQMRERLDTFIEMTYGHVRDSLLREVMIFSASNAVAFAALGLLVLWKPAARLQLVLAAGVLVGAVILTSMGYLFGQNWIHTILFNDYMGLAYAAYLAAVALLLTDVAFNQAKVTTSLCNAVLDAAGSALHVVPC